MWTRRCKEKGIQYIYVTMHSKTLFYCMKGVILWMWQKNFDLLIGFSCSQVGTVEFCQLSLSFPLADSYLSSVQS